MDPRGPCLVLIALATAVVLYLRVIDWQIEEFPTPVVSPDDFRLLPFVCRPMEFRRASVDRPKSPRNRVNDVERETSRSRG